MQFSVCIDQEPYGQVVKIYLVARGVRRKALLEITLPSHPNDPISLLQHISTDKTILSSESSSTLHILARLTEQ